LKTCKDFTGLGIGCCEGCHWEVDHNLPGGSALITIQLEGERAHMCCEIADFFYPDESWKKRSKTGQWAQPE
jgi:hypothetical protein